MFESSPYVGCFCESLKSCSNVHKALFSKEERKLAEELLCLCTHSVLLLAKTTSRKYNWIRVISLRRIYSRLSSDPLDALRSSLSSLIEAGYIELFNDQHFETSVWDVLSTCLTVSEIKVLCSRMSISSATLGKTKEQHIQSLWSKCATQKTIFGLSLVHRLGNLIVKIVEELDGPVWSVKSAVPVIIRVRPDILTLIRRIQRIFQVCENSRDWVSGSATTIFDPINMSLPLRVAFKKARFPRTTLDSDCALFSIYDFESSGECAYMGTNRINRFHRWEAANELSCLYEEVC